LAAPIRPAVKEFQRKLLCLVRPPHAGALWLRTAAPKQRSYVLFVR
jgi:hypothetical protein